MAACPIVYAIFIDFFFHNQEVLFCQMLDLQWLFCVFSGLQLQWPDASLKSISILIKIHTPKPTDFLTLWSLAMVAAYIYTT